MSESQSPDTEALLAQMTWVRRLAAQLVADPNRVDDLVQDTMAAALTRPPSREKHARSWLAGVVRNLVRQDRRAHARRAVRERASARGELQPSSSELVERWALHKELVGAVEALEEPYREALLLRYFEGLPPREIARRLEQPVKTVKTRLARALERLRARLAVRYEKDGRDWLAALLPLAKLPLPQTALAATTLGALAVNTKLLVALIALVVGGSFAGVYWMGADPVDVQGVATAPGIASPRGEVAPTPLVFEDEPRTQVVEVAPAHALAPTPVVEVEGAALPALRTVAGRVFDGEARPVAGMELGWRGGEPVRDARGEPLRTDAAGAFRFATEQAGVIEARAPDWVTVLAGSVRPGSEIESVLVVAPAIRVGGRVIDEAGQPLAAVAVRLVLPEGFEARFPRTLEGSTRTAWFERTDEQGRFAFPRAPRLLGSNLRAEAEGFRTAVLAAPEGSFDGIVIVLERHVARDGELQGEVIDAAGRRVPGARVSLGAFSTLSDDNGQFGIDLGLAVGTDRLLAVKPGHQLGVFHRPGPKTGENLGWPDYVVLELGGPPLSIRGRVLGLDGKPAAGVQVWIDDPTCFGLLGGSPAMVENLIAGAAIEDSGGPDRETLARQIRQGGYLDIDDVPKTSSAGWSWIDTDARGNFTLDGLMPRDYVLRALDPETLVMHTTGPVAAGASGVEIALSSARIQKEVVGRVVSRAGRPLAGLRVRALCVPFQVRMQIEATTFDSRFLRFGGTARTDEEGRFRFENLPREGLQFYLDGDAILPERVVPERDELRAELRITATAKCLVEVVLEDPESADRILFLDGDGAEVDVFVIRHEAIEVVSDHELVDGRSGVIAIAEGAARLVLSKAGEIVDEREIVPVPGEVLEIRF